jgi:pimeloyl-ACP methyl ester carboxylesterase
VAIINIMLRYKFPGQLSQFRFKNYIRDNIGMFQRDFLRFEGVTISYVQKNVEAERSIFFFHGNCNSADLWTNQLSNNSLDDYRLIAFDLPAHGKSGIPRDITKCNLLWLAEIMSKCVTELSKDQPYILCGHSLGGNIVAEMLATGISPSGLVLIGSNFVGEGITPSDIISDALVSEVLYTNTASLQDIQIYLKRASIARNQTNQDLLLKNYLQVDSGFREAFPASVARGDYSDEINLIKCFNKPILLVFGGMDTICSKKLMTPILPVARGKTIYTIEDAGHLVVLDQPEKFNALLNEFLNEVYI